MLIRLSAVVSLLILNLSADEPFRILEYNSPIIWEDDFDDGISLHEKYEDVNTRNGLAVTQNDAFSGNYSLEQRYIEGQEDAGWIIKVNNEGFPDHIFMRWYHKFEEGFVELPPKMARVRHRNRRIWETTYAVHCWIASSGEVVLDVSAKNSSQANPSGWLPVARSGFNYYEYMNEWICFEMEVKVNTPGMTDGLYRLWINDELRIERLDVDLRGETDYKITELMLDCYWNGGSPKEQSRYYDDFVVSEARIGMKPEDPTNIDHERKNLPLEFSLSQNYPNPFNPSTTISYSLAAEGNVSLNVYDILGREVATLVNETKPAGTHTAFWNGSNEQGERVGSGIYFYQLKTNAGIIDTKKMTLIK